MPSLEHVGRPFWTIVVIALLLSLGFFQVTKWLGFDITPMFTELIVFSIALPILTLAVERLIKGSRNKVETYEPNLLHLTVHYIKVKGSNPSGPQDLIQPRFVENDDTHKAYRIPVWLEKRTSK